MKFSFSPKRLIQSKNNILITHSHTNNPAPVKPSKDLMKLIQRLVVLELYELKRNALSLTNKEMIMVTSYLSHNYYDVNMNNLFEIFKYRSNERLCHILFNQWQDSYDNNELNQYIRKLLKIDEKLIMLIRKNHTDEMEFDRFLKEGQIPINYVKMIMDYPFEGKLNLKQKLEYFGIRKESRLTYDCEFLYYTLCNRNDYLYVKETDLLIVVKKYNESQLKCFLKNLLKNLSLKDLNNLLGIARYLQTKVGENYSKKFIDFFSGFSAKIVQKYVDWINIGKIEEYFGEDERSMFWKNYRFVKVKKFPSSNSVVMEFKKHIVVEFLGRSMGPTYIYKKIYFEQNVKKWFTRTSHDNISMRRQLYRYTSYEDEGVKFKDNVGIRMIHTPNPGWESKFTSVLLKNRITEYIIE